MITITITGPVVVTDDATEKPITDPKRLRQFDGLHSGRETCSKYHDGEVADLELKGGAVTLVFDAAKKKLRVVSAFTSPRKLTAKELRDLVDDTQGQWSDGIGEGCFDTVMDKPEGVHRPVPARRQGDGDAGGRRQAGPEVGEGVE